MTPDQLHEMLSGAAGIAGLVAVAVTATFKKEIGKKLRTAGYAIKSFLF